MPYSWRGFITAFYDGFFRRISSRCFNNAFSFIFWSAFLSAGGYCLFIENLVYKSLFVKLFRIWDFKLLCNIKQFRNEHIVQLQNVVHNGLLVIKIKKPAVKGC